MGPAACHSKARRVERKLGFIPDAGKWWGRWRTPVQRPILHPGPPDQLGMRAFTESGEGYMQKEHRHLPQSSPQLVISGRTSVVCVVCSTGSVQFRVQLFPFLCRQFSELWRLKCWVQSAHPALHFSTWGFRVCKSSQEVAQNVIYSP